MNFTMLDFFCNFSPNNTCKNHIMKRISRTIALIISFVICATTAFAADVAWSFKILDENTDHPAIEITAAVPAGFHLYSSDTPAGGPVPMQFFIDVKGAKKVGTPKANKNYKVEYNDIFEINEHYYTGTVKFVQKLKPTADKFDATVEVKGQICTEDGMCVPTGTTKKLSGKAKATDKDAAEDEKEEAADAADTTAMAVDSLQAADGALTPGADNAIMGSNPEWWSNVEAEIKALGDNPGQTERSLLYIFIAGFIGGLIALVTPCVWPMIPMTVSFFLKQKKSRSASIRSALVYGGSIIVIYVALGLLITILFGASALNDLATSAIFNIIFFLLLVVFAISFMGGFELTLPSKWTNKMDSKVDSTTGLLSIFFMAFTLALVSFSCTGPIIGTLLVEAAASSNFVSPAVGMFGFSLALALPFALFAMFPTMLNSMPKSGGWMNTVKVVLGFLELALSLKFLSVADLAYGWRILDREVFVALWIVIFALLGVYLLGKITFPHDDKVEKTGVTRFMLACISFAFAIYMLPGLWGAPLKTISAFAPPAHTQDFSLYDGDVHAQTEDFEDAMRKAAAAGKPVLVDFSGHGCVNCRKMEAAVWTDAKVKNTIDDKYVLVTLMVDDKQPLAQPMTVKESDGTERTLRTVGDKWSWLQRTKFGANAQPYHVILDGNGKPLTSPQVFTDNVKEYQDFLNAGLSNYDEQKNKQEEGK